MSPNQARLTVDLDALAANFDLLRTLAGSGEVAPVVKANAYGLGLVPVARRLRAEGAGSFFVSRLSEGEGLRAALGPDPIIHVLDGCTPGSGPRLAAAGLNPVLNDAAQIGAWLHAGGRSAALQVDTGMNRMGLRPEAVERLVADGLGPIEISLVLTHLSCGSVQGHPMNRRQAKAFEAVRGLFPNARASLANSGALFQDPAFALDVARPGIALYGGGPFDRPDVRIRPVAIFEAPILQIRDVLKGEAIGYGASFIADRPLRAAIVGAGYADGVLRAQSSVGYGWLHGARRRYLGRVSMDLIAIDVSDCAEAQCGDMVQLLGAEVLLDEVAAGSGTISYEILTRLGARGEITYRGRAA